MKLNDDLYGFLPEFRLQSAVNSGELGKSHRASQITFIMSLSGHISGLEITYIK